MGWLRYSARMLICLAWVLGGLLVLSTVFRLFGGDTRLRIIRRWSAGLMAIAGLTVEVSGALPRQDALLQADPDAPKGWLWVANHVSWLDIFALNAVHGAVFVAKSEIRAWPLLGWLVAGAGTIFVERGSRHAIRHVNKTVGHALQQGAVVAVFPEGTTTEGTTLLPFHANLFDPALGVAARIQPVLLRYCQNGRFSTLPAYVGDQTLMQNLWMVLSATGMSVQVNLLPPLDLDRVASQARTRRHDAAEAARQAIAEAMDSAR